MSRGGARPGSGRKAKPESKAVKIRIPLYIYERLPKNKSEYITSLLEREMKK
ncbi:MAG: hypothetical protein J6R25_00795 [Bacteroidales bacterium]|nr:hypothetical protein [Bacteroidales bacterium]